MSRHRVLLPTVGTTLIALLCCPVFALQPVSPQNQSASPSEFTVNVSKSTAVSPPVNSAPASLPPDVLKGLGTSGLAGLTAIAEHLEKPLDVAKAAGAIERFGRAKAVGDIAGTILYGLDDANANLDHNRLAEWDAIRDYGIGLVPGIGTAYSIVEPLVEARLRWQLRQQGMTDDEIDQTVLATKRLGEQRAWQFISDQTFFGLVASENPFDIVNSATKQAASTITGGSLLLVDPIDEFIASKQATNVPGLAITDGVQINPGDVAETTAESGSALNTDADIQISSELVDNQTPYAMSFSGISIVDSGPLIRPVATPVNTSSGGFWQNLLQIGIVALQAYNTYEAMRSPHAPAATLQGRKQQLQSPAGKQQCSTPEECAALNLVRQTCSIRNDCNQWGGPPPPSPPNPNCSVKCGYVGNSFMCVGNPCFPKN